MHAYAGHGTRGISTQLSNGCLEWTDSLAKGRRESDWRYVNVTVSTFGRCHDLSSFCMSLICLYGRSLDDC